jgi:hypothetical protein
MSDYFAALMRSAGSIPVDAGARAGTPAPHAPGDDLREEHVEVVAAAPPGPASVQPLAHDEAAIEEMPERSHGGAPAAAGVAPLPSATSSPDVAVPESVRASPLPALALPSTVPLAPVEQHAAMNPVVRAALRWVAADPGNLAGAPAPGVASPSANVDPRQPAQRTETRALAVERSGRRSPIDPAVPALHRAGPAPRQVAPQMDLSPAPRSPRMATREEVAREARGDAQRVEVSIGTIHVRVDAPEPRVVAQPAAPPPRPAPAPPAERSGFSRCRLPRL